MCPVRDKDARGLRGTLHVIKGFEALTQPRDLNAYGGVGPGIKIGATVKRFRRDRVLVNLLAATLPKVGEELSQGRSVLKGATCQYSLEELLLVL